MSTTPILVVDISAALDGTDPELVARALGDAVRDVGVLQIIGHGIDPTMYHRLHDAAVPLWTRPADELDRWTSPIGHPFRGVTDELNEAGDVRRQGLQNHRFLTPEDAVADGVPAKFADFLGGNTFPSPSATACCASRTPAERGGTRRMAQQLTAQMTPTSGGTS